MVKHGKYCHYSARAALLYCCIVLGGEESGICLFWRKKGGHHDRIPNYANHTSFILFLVTMAKTDRPMMMMTAWAGLVLIAQNQLILEVGNKKTS